MHQVTDSPQIAELFRHDCIYQSCPPRWTAFRSHEDEDADREARMAAVPIVHRHSFEDKKWETLDFTVNDTHMRKLLSKAFEGYQGLDMKLELWKFTQPYRALVHRWNLLNDLHAELMGDASAEVEEKQAAQTLMDFLSPIMAPSIGAVAQTRETGMVLFDDVWTIFPPSELIFTHVSGIPAIYRVLKYKLKETMSGTFWRITVENVDWDGSKCGYSEKNIKIWRFTGLRNVDSLAAYPLSFHHDLDTLKHKMMERGRKFERLRGYHLQHYKGKAQSLTGDYSERPVCPHLSPFPLPFCMVSDPIIGRRSGNHRCVRLLHFSQHCEASPAVSLGGRSSHDRSRLQKREFPSVLSIRVKI